MKTVDVVIKRTLSFSQHLQLPVCFLELDVAVWNENTDYQHSLNVVHNIRVANDTAERAVSLTEEYSAILTKEDSEEQSLSQVVKQHR